MILIDAPQQWVGRLAARLGPSAHLISDLPGTAGRDELLAFAHRIGMRETWLQKAGTPEEHFDVFASRLDRALRAGAKQVTRFELVTTIRAKRTSAATANKENRDERI